MYFLNHTLWSVILCMSTLWQAIRNLIQFRNHVFKAENIPLPEATPAESAPSPTSPLTCPYEYILATCHLAKAMLFSYAALEATTDTCSLNSPLHRNFCLILYPLTTGVAVAQTGYQAYQLKSYLKR